MTIFSFPEINSGQGSGQVYNTAKHYRPRKQVPNTN